VAGIIQHYSARAARDAARNDHRRDAELNAITELAAALASHRRAMVIREELRLAATDPDLIAAARSDSHATRSAIEAPRVRVSILTPALTPAADEAVQAAYALRGAPDLDTLASRRHEAVKAAERFVTAAAHRFD